MSENNNRPFDTLVGLYQPLPSRLCFFFQGSDRQQVPPQWIDGLIAKQIGSDIWSSHR